MTVSTEWGIWIHAVRPVPELVALAVHAESRGASMILVADEGTDRDIYVTLAAIAQNTSRLLLVPGVTNPHSRHPVATAAALASLAELAPGRIVVGLGSGGTLVLGPMGLRPARPFTALAEAVDVINALLDGQVVHHTGEFTVDGAQLSWSSGRLPIAIAGRGPRAQRLANSRSDWVLVAGKPIDQLATLSTDLREQASARGQEVRLVWNPAAALHPEHADRMRSHLSYMTVDMPQKWRDRLGVTDSQVTALREALAQGGPEAAGPLVPDTVLDAFALIGDREQIVGRLAFVVAAAKPDLLVFDLHEQSPEYIDEIAALVAESTSFPASDARTLAGAS